MVIANPLQPFLWGSGGEQMTPQQVARQREIADALMGSVGDTSPVQHWLQGVPRLTNALGFSMRENLANEQETRGRDAFQDRFDSILGGGSPIRTADTGSVASLLAESAAVTSTPALDAATGVAASGDLQSYRDAIASIESAGSGDYAAVGPTHPSLGRALGRYQVMEANVGPWSRQVLGREVTPDEFMASPETQDAIFDGIFGGYVDQFGPEGAAQAWFAGPGSIGAAGAENRSDSLGTTVSSYVDRFANATGGGGAAPMPSSGAPVQVAQAPQYNIGELIGLANDPWADETSRSIAMSLVEQQLTPPAPLEPIEVGGVLLDPVTYEPIFDSRDGGAGLINAGNGNIYNPNSGEWIQAPAGASGAPDVQTFYDEETGFPYKAQWNPETQEWMRVGGVEAPSGTMLSVDPATGAVTFQQGNVSGSGGRFTEQQSKDNVYVTRATGANAELGAVSETTGQPIDSTLTDAWARAGNADPTGVARGAMQSDDFQAADRAGREFLASILRKDTGAAVTPSEEQMYGWMYLPVPGDSPATIEAKRLARERAIIAIEAGMSPEQIRITEEANAIANGLRPPENTSSDQPQQSQSNPDVVDWQTYFNQ